MKTTLMLAGALLLAALPLLGEGTAGDNGKFRRFFSWGAPVNEEVARKYAEAGVTDITVHNPRQCELALKYGMRPYWKVFLPEGPWRQKMTPDEEAYSAYISGRDLDPKLPKAERRKILDRRRIEKQHRYGGEAVTDPDVLGERDIRCFISDTDFALSAKKLDELVGNAPKESCGIFLDYIGYMNQRGCYCESCLSKYRAYLKARNLADTQSARDGFYREQLELYYNKVIDRIKKLRPDYKVVVHVYPDFRADHLPGNRFRADCCGQTVAWYFQWPSEKIAKYTKYVVEHAKDRYPEAEGVPFLGLNADPTSSLGYKSPADVERELQVILAAGGRSLMVCSGHCIIKPGYFEVFRKYCGKSKPEPATGQN